LESEASTRSPRPYHSPRRQEQTRQTRLAILGAARPLFIQQGYAGTSMADIARAAGVSIKTVEAAFGTKARLLTALRDITIAGDDEAVPLAQRSWFKEMLDQPDPRRQLELHARNTGRIKRRTAALNEVIRRAAQVDPEIEELWQVFQNQFLADQRLVAESLASKGVLRPGLNVDAASETIRALNHPSFYYLVVHDQGWAVEYFERWLTDVLIRHLLP
jgi:TetR/AcrR family transcriptional regulator, regulator of autoinduction and epiphytic fitness